jgi:hypothetical protein
MLHSIPAVFLAKATCYQSQLKAKRGHFSTMDIKMTHKHARFTNRLFTSLDFAFRDRKIKRIDNHSLNF